MGHRATLRKEERREGLGTQHAIQNHQADHQIDHSKAAHLTNRSDRSSNDSIAETRQMRHELWRDRNDSERADDLQRRVDVALPRWALAARLPSRDLQDVGTAPPIRPHWRCFREEGREVCVLHRTRSYRHRQLSESLHAQLGVPRIQQKLEEDRRDLHLGTQQPNIRLLRKWILEVRLRREIWFCSI